MTAGNLLHLSEPRSSHLQNGTIMAHSCHSVSPPTETLSAHGAWSGLGYHCGLTIIKSCSSVNLASSKKENQAFHNQGSDTAQLGSGEPVLFTTPHPHSLHNLAEIRVLSKCPGLVPVCLDLTWPNCPHSQSWRGHRQHLPPPPPQTCLAPLTSPFSCVVSLA